jgi:hypothetical protein
MSGREREFTREDKIWSKEDLSWGGEDVEDGVIRFELSRPRQSRTEQEAHYQSHYAVEKKKRGGRQTRPGKEVEAKEGAIG